MAEERVLLHMSTLKIVSLQKKHRYVELEKVARSNLWLVTYTLAETHFGVKLSSFEFHYDWCRHHVLTKKKWRVLNKNKKKLRMVV